MVRSSYWRGFVATSRSTSPHLNRWQLSTLRLSARTWSSGSRRRWSHSKRMKSGSSSRWTARTASTGLRTCSSRTPASRPQDPSGFGDGPSVVGNRAQGERRHDRVEALVGKVEGLGVTHTQIGGPPEALGAPAGDTEHGRAQLDGGEPDIAAVVGQIAPGAGGELEYLALRLLAGPSPPLGEEKRLG